MLVRDLPVFELHHHDVRNFYMFTCGRNTGQDVIPLCVVREAENEFVHHLILADGARDRRHCCILWNLIYEMLTVEAADSSAAVASGHDRNAMHVRFGDHGFHGGVDVAICELSLYMVVENCVDAANLF